MAVTVERTPNPNALKFVVGRAVGDPRTYRSTEDAGEQWAREILGLEGIQQVFATGDFVSVTKAPEAGWDDLSGPVQAILRTEFDDG